MLILHKTAVRLKQKFREVLQNIPPICTLQFESKEDHLFIETLKDGEENLVSNLARQGEQSTASLFS